MRYSKCPLSASVKLDVGDPWTRVADQEQVEVAVEVNRRRTMGTSKPEVQRPELGSLGLCGCGQQVPVTSVCSPWSRRLPVMDQSVLRSRSGLPVV